MMFCNTGVPNEHKWYGFLSQFEPFLYSASPWARSLDNLVWDAEIVRANELKLYVSKIGSSKFNRLYGKYFQNDKEGLSEKGTFVFHGKFGSGMCIA